MTQPAPARITVGVDTHAEVHVAVAKDSFGRRLDAISVPTTLAGYAELLGWAQRLDEIEAWGIEGTGSFGAGLARFLPGRGHPQSRGRALLLEIDGSLLSWGNAAAGAPAPAASPGHHVAASRTAATPCRP